MMRVYIITANAKVASGLDSIPASSKNSGNSVAADEAVLKKSTLKYTKIPLEEFVLKVVSSLLNFCDNLSMWFEFLHFVGQLLDILNVHCTVIILFLQL